MPDHKEDLLFARRAVRDDTVFAELFDTYSRLVYNIAYRFAGSEADAADITQDAFLKLWRSLPGYRGECALSTFLCRITLSCAYDFGRGKKRRFALSLTAEDEEGDYQWDLPETDVGSLPEEAAVRTAEIEAVREAVDALPPEQRLILTLRDFGDLSYEEIADQLGLELGTVKSRLFRARAAVKEILIRGNFFPSGPSKQVKKERTNREETTERESFL